MLARLVLLLSSLAALCPGHTVPAGQTLKVRLLYPVGSHFSRKGDPVRAVLTAPIQVSGGTSISAGTEIHGSVTSVRRVGLGFRNQTASLHLTFSQVLPTGHAPIDIAARVLEIENAREKVAPDGKILGILASISPHFLVDSRVKYLPTFRAWADPFMLAYKASFPFFPEPEILLPAGADLVLALEEPLEIPLALEVDAAYLPSFAPEEIAELKELVESLPTRTRTKEDGQESDLINLLFIGAPEEVVSAFRSAGWAGSDRRSIRSFLRSARAFFENRTYPEAPMSRLYVDGRGQDMSWQKGLNSYARRHHLRLWRRPSVWRGEDVWLVAATRDAGIGVSLSRFHFYHRIDPRIDEERAKVIEELAFQGCVAAYHLVARPGVTRRTVNGTGDAIVTDGAVAAIRLQSCRASFLAFSGPMPKQGNFFSRLLRRQVLTLRHDVLNANIVLGPYQMVRTLQHQLSRPPRPVNAFRDGTP